MTKNYYKFKVDLLKETINNINSNYKHFELKINILKMKEVN